MRVCISLYEYDSPLEFYKLPIDSLIEWSSNISDHVKMRIEAIKKARKK